MLSQQIFCIQRAQQSRTVFVIVLHVHVSIWFNRNIGPEGTLRKIKLKFISMGTYNCKQQKSITQLCKQRLSSNILNIGKKFLNQFISFRNHVTISIPKETERLQQNEKHGLQIDKAQQQTSTYHLKHYTAQTQVEYPSSNRI